MIDRVFWLSMSGEYGPLSRPRECHFIGELSSMIDGGTIVALRVSPPFSDEHLEPPAVNEAHVVVSRAFGKTYSLGEDAIQRFLLFDAPMPVRVGRILDLSCLTHSSYDRRHIQPLPRGALFANEADAQAFSSQHRRPRGTA